MADEKKYVSVTIPADALNEWETMKVVTINGVDYAIPVDEPTPVPENVAAVVNNWIIEAKKAKDEYKKRMKELENEFK